MTNAQMLALLVGAVIPPLISIIQQPSWPDWLRAIVTGVVCILVGYLTVFFAGDLDGKDIATSILIVLVAALATYRGFWKPTGVSAAIEVRTSPSGEHSP